MAPKDDMKLVFDVTGMLVSFIMTSFPMEFTVSKDPNDINSAELSHLHHMSLLVRFLGPFYGLIISTVLLVTLALHYPMTQDVWVTRFIIAFGCVGYLSILITDMITDMICHHISMTLKLLLIPVTVCTHVLRFASQGQLAQLEAAPFICSLIGVIPGVLCLIPLDGEFVAHLLRDLAFYIATLVGATSRLLDAIVICFHKTRESANYFRCRLQECFL